MINWVLDHVHPVLAGTFAGTAAGMIFFAVWEYFFPSNPEQ
jgi:hypothetical protein